MRKILLIHGWNYKNYTVSGSTDAWGNRSRFVAALADVFEVLRFNLPGFGGEKEMDRPWTLDDFVCLLDEMIKKERPDIVLGYSFGGAILLRWKAMTGNTTVKAFLVSPAILRHYEHKGVSALWLKHFVPEWLGAIARDFYLVRVRKNPFYAKATPVMRATYRNIVGLDLREDLLKVSDELVLFYGEGDTVTPPELVRDFLVSHRGHHRLVVLPGGGHDIANTHTDSLISKLVQHT